MKLARNILAAAIFAGAAIASPAFAGTTLHVFLWDAGADMDMLDNHKIGDGADHATDTMGVTANVTTVPAGEITFDVLNASTDSEHEMVVSKLGPDGTLPYVADMARVDEEAAGSAGEVSELAPGDSGALTVTLEPGTYALYCNIAGHYASGMWTILTVK